MVITGLTKALSKLAGIHIPNSSQTVPERFIVLTDETRI